ncbi:hypothetical protein BZA77DRAFT_176779 [Pyronema omphalodes]|nr:hypothetical protein BZA77DRAFT_176779 [Pyronema omphalodes]
MDAPSTRALISSIIQQLSSFTTGATKDFSNLPPKAQQLLVTLHCLLPTTLLPALDLLDRELVIRVSDTTTPEPQRAYYVQSAAPVNSTGKFSARLVRYEVRLRPWNCTCASFTFAAYKDFVEDESFELGETEELEETDETEELEETEELDDTDELEEAEEPEETEQSQETEEVEEAIWGGITLDQNPPVCKHLLACVLGEYCFRDRVIEETISPLAMAEITCQWD